MSDSRNYPVKGRSANRNLIIATHEVGHGLLCRILGNSVWSITIARAHGYEGRVIRSGSSSEYALTGEHPDMPTDEILSVCERLERMNPQVGTARVADSEVIIRAQSMIIEPVGGRVAEEVFHPGEDDLGAQHDHTEAEAFARVACAAGSSPAVAALLLYARAEAEALLKQHQDIFFAIRAALIEAGTLSGDQLDTIIADTVAARAVKREQERRADWAQRGLNAAAFQAYRG